MAIDGLIILEPSGRPIIQTNFKSTSTAYPILHIDAFNNALSDSVNGQPDPVLYVSTLEGPSACCHVECGDGLRLLCPVSGDVDALYVFSFLQLFCETLQDYLGEISSSTLRDHFDVVYQLLEEMLDNGHPLTTERNALRDIVIPPSLLNKILSATGVSGLAKASSNPFSSPIPWRKMGTKHNNNEIYFDMIEDMRAIVDKNGTTVSNQVWGKIETNCKLSGIPDLLLTFADTKYLHDCSFHPCVRLQRWTRDKSLSFVPPDGRFVLMDYRYAPAPNSAAVTPRPIPVPFSLAPAISLESNGGSLNFTLTSRLSTRVMERLTVELHLGQGAVGANCVVSSGATWGFDPKTHRLKWEIRKAPQGSSHTLRGSFTTTGQPQPSKAFQITFENSQSTFSGIKVDQLKVSNETYKLFKGMRGRSCGEVEWRW
ncbi:clathrin adaptor mu subunit [Pyrrhoderma noxium]|uniref:Clathrin adaptor mu subunit n=1 Tax=Pyrrhoderma noxium TaxID=2282107 RepID=A0A286UNK6_9AGAM|nr:clathrin adaptor mu subunit [Pyrrhoderma noxium]